MVKRRRNAVVERLIILSSQTITKEDVERYVVPVSADQSNPKLNELFSRCNDLDEVLTFVREAYESRQG